MKSQAITPQHSVCAALEPRWTRLLRLLGTAVLVVFSLILVSATRFTVQVPDLATILRLAAFVSALGMLASSIAAFWWRAPGLRRVEWAAYLMLALLIGEQFAVGPKGGPIQSVALIFGVLVFAIVLARVTRRESAQAACNCG